MADQEHGSDIATRLKSYADGLAAIAEQEQGELDELERRARAKRRTIRQIHDAIKALDPAESASKKRVGPVKGKPRQATVDAVMAAFREAADEGVTYKDLTDRTGFSHDTVARAVKWLRTQEEVRYVGGSGNTAPVFKLMPNSEPLALAS